jgi:hypothetical protein
MLKINSERNKKQVMNKYRGEVLNKNKKAKTKKKSYNSKSKKENLLFLIKSIKRLKKSIISIKIHQKRN